MRDFLFVFSTDPCAMPYTWYGTRDQVYGWAKEASGTGALPMVQYGPDARVPVLQWTISRVVEWSPSAQELVEGTTLERCDDA